MQLLAKTASWARSNWKPGASSESPMWEIRMESQPPVCCPPACALCPVGICGVTRWTEDLCFCRCVTLTWSLCAQLVQELPGCQAGAGGILRGERRALAPCRRCPAHVSLYTGQGLHRDRVGTWETAGQQVGLMSGGQWRESSPTGGHPHKP